MDAQQGSTPKNPRNWLALAGLLSLGLMLLLTLRGPGVSRAVQVEDGGTYDSLPAAIAAAETGDTVRVPAGVYAGGVVIDKQLVIKAEVGAWVDGGCAAENGLRVTAAGVRIEGIGVRNTAGAAIEVHADDAVIDGARIEGWNCRRGEEQLRAGVACWYCSNLTVANSRFDNERGFGNAIWLKSTDDQPSEGGHRIAGNEISGGFDGIGSETESDVRGGFHSNTVIEDNRIRDCWDDGIQVEGRNENVVVRRNMISGCSAGIAFSPNLVGPLLIEENVIKDMTAGFYDSSACFKVGRGGEGVAYLTANVCRTDGDGLKQSNPGLSRIVAEANCIEVSRYVIDFSGTPPEGTSLSDNHLVSSDEERFIKWGGESFTSADFRPETGQNRDNGKEPAC